MTEDPSSGTAALLAAAWAAAVAPAGQQHSGQHAGRGQQGNSDDSGGACPAGAPGGP